MALPHSLNIFDYPAKFQFGQAGAPCSGKSCCTDTCIQMIVNFYKEKNPSLAEIRRAAQAKTSYNEDPCTGINHIETLNALAAYGITWYKASFGASANDVYEKVAVGPVIVGVHYGSYPNEHSHCGSNKAEISGRTDCGFTGAHAILAIGRREHTVSGATHRDLFMRDPDHNSPARPEKPAFDRITRSQLDRAMSNIVPYTAFTQTYMLYPIKKKSF